MTETCEHLLAIVNSCVYYAPAHSTALLGEFQSSRRALKPTEYDQVGQQLVSVDLFGIKDLYISQMTVNLKSNLCVGAVNFFPTVSYCFMIAITTTNAHSCKRWRWLYWNIYGQIDIHFIVARFFIKELFMFFLNWLDIRKGVAPCDLKVFFSEYTAFIYQNVNSWWYIRK